MQFTLDPQKKRTWNFGWWKGSGQGRFGFWFGAACLVVAVVSAVRLPGAWDSSAFGDPFASDEAVLGNIAAVCWLAVPLALAAIFWGGILRYAIAEVNSLSGESLAIEGGVLTMTYHVVGDEPGAMDVGAADLARCSWKWDPGLRKLTVRAEERGAVREWHYRDYAHEAAVPFGAMEEGDTMVFSPYFDPDPVEVLRGMGVPESK